MSDKNMIIIHTLFVTSENVILRQKCQKFSFQKKKKEFEDVNI